MEYYDALRAAWAKLSDGTTEDKLSAINAKTANGPERPVPVSEVSALWWRQGAWLQIKAAVTTSVGAAAAVALNEDMRIQTIHMGEPIVAQMLSEMVSKSVISPQQADEVLALKNTVVPWWSAPVSDGGGGLQAPVAHSDLLQAGKLT